MDLPQVKLSHDKSIHLSRLSLELYSSLSKKQNPNRKCDKALDERFGTAIGMTQSIPDLNGRNFANTLKFTFFLFCFDVALKGAIDNTSLLVRAIAWHITDEKQSPLPMSTQFNDAYLCYYVLICTVESV